MPYRALRRSCNLKPKGRGQAIPGHTPNNVAISAQNRNCSTEFKGCCSVIKAALTNPQRSFAIKVAASSSSP